jgi:hypothetical protein
MDLTHIFLAILSGIGIVLVFLSQRSAQRSQERLAAIMERLDQNQARIADHTRLIAEFVARNEALTKAVLLQFQPREQH